MTWSKLSAHVATVDPDKLALVIVKLSQRAIDANGFSQREADQLLNALRQHNPKALVLVTPEGTSVESFTAEQALTFVAAVAARITRDELLSIGLRRMDS
jgi:hypothetical protein